MLGAGVTHKSKFAKKIIKSFMKGNWMNKSSWDTQKLWDGELMEYKLGTSSMSFLRNGRNALSIRIKATVGMCCCSYYYINTSYMSLYSHLFVFNTDNFLRIEEPGKTPNEAVRIKLQALKRLVSNGRNCGSVCWNKCIPLIASFCTQKEHHSQMTYRQASNLASITKVSYLTKIYKEIRGKKSSECISAPKFAILLTVLQNNITNENQIYAWKPAEP